MRVRDVFAGAAAAVLMANSARAQDASPLVKRGAYEDLQMFGQVLNQIRINHADSLDTHALFMAAIEGMVHAADPHSFVISYMRLSPAKERAYRDNKLTPVPLSFQYVGGAPVVAGVAAGSSARALDILPGDELIAIDGLPVTATSAQELEIVLSGSRSELARLTFERRRVDGTLVRFERSVKRESPADETAVPIATMLDSSTGYVRVTTFMGEHVADDLHSALERLENSGMKRLVMDLRDNGGGSVAEAAHVAGEFLPRGTIVYTSSGRKEETTDTGRVQRSFWRSERRYPIVVMVNAGTASASEIVAGALQDHDRALIVGRPTFGKSLLMQGFPMSDGSLLVLVIGQVKTPCGRAVQREYRSISRHEYYRLAGAERDTANRPSCKTDAGRTVYGGGGIYPDVVLPDSAVSPRWLQRLNEQQTVLTWAGSYVDASPPALQSADAFVAMQALSQSTIDDFRAFAGKQGVEIPADANAVLQRRLRAAIAYAKWGDEVAYRVSVSSDEAIRRAVASFAQATSVLASSPR